MPIWTDARFDLEPYLPLYRALRARNRYQYGVILPLDVSVAKDREGFRTFRLPEGVLIISRRPVKKYGLQKIQEKPVYLTFFILVWDDEKQRIRLQINRGYVRLQLKRAMDFSRRQSWGARRKSVREYLKQINDLTRELQRISKMCFVYPETKRAYNTKLRRIVVEYLTSVHGLSKGKALAVVRSYLLRW